MTLASCIKKAGKALSTEDKQSIEQLVASGLSEYDAVAQHILTLDQELTTIAEAAAEQGGSVTYEQYEPPGELDKTALPTSLRDKMDQAFPGIIGMLERAGIARLAQSRDLPPGINKNAQAYVKDGQVVFVEDNITADQDVRGLMLHEIGVHLRHLGQTEFKPLLKQFNKLRNVDPRVEKAYSRVPDATPEALVDEEALGYYVENNPSLPLAKKIIAWFREKLRSMASLMGSDRSAFSRWAKALSADDMLYMATKAMTNFNIVTDPKNPDIKYMVAYHGTPHKFDKFSLEAMGTGEGAQAYGWGLYFAGKREIAEFYRDKLSTRSVKVKGDRYGEFVTEPLARTMADALADGSSKEEALESALEDAEFAVFKLESSVERYRNIIKMDSAEQSEKEYLERELLPDLAEAKASLMFMQSLSPDDISLDHGFLYQVDIPQDNELLDWDKPLSEQSEVVKERFASDNNANAFANWYAQQSADLGPEFKWESLSLNQKKQQAKRYYRDTGLPYSPALEAELYGEKTGERLYTDITKDASNALYDRKGPIWDMIKDDPGRLNYTLDQLASMYLNSLGIPGLRFLDGQSRNKTYKDIKREFLEEMPEDADFDEIESLVGQGVFSPNNEAIIKGLMDSDWLGFDYPAQAISAAVSKNMMDYDPSSSLVDAVVSAREDGTRNYVIWDEDRVTIEAVNDQQHQADTLYSILEDDNLVIKYSIPQHNPYDDAFESLGDKDKTVFEKAKKLMKRELLPGGLLPEQVFNQKLERDFEIQTFEFDISNHLGHFEKAIEEGYDTPYKSIDDATKAQLNEALGGSEPDPSIPEVVREQIYAMRSVIRGLSEDYANLLRQEIDELGDGPQAEAKKQLLATILNNLDTYVHRSYRAFDDPAWPRKVPRETYDAAARYLEQQYAGDGQVTDAIRERVANKLELMLEEGTAFDSMEAFIKESKLGAKDLSVLIRRKQIAPEIRALLGEYTEPEINFTKSVTKMARLVMNQRFLNKVKEIGVGEFLFTEDDRPRNATRKIAADSSEVYAPLNGFYTYPEVEQAFRDALGKENMEDWFRMIVRANGLVKFGKTVLSPTTAFRNWMSASFFAMANGHFDFTQMRKSVQSIREYFTHGAGKDDYLKKMKRLGVIYDTPYAGEMMDLLADSRLENALYDKKPFTGVRAAIEFAQKFYQYGDDFWKIMGFENEKAIQMKYNNLSEAEAELVAAERIRNTYPTYSLTGRFVQRLRRFPLAGTFVSFPAEIIRTSYHILNYLKQDMQSNRALGLRRAMGLAFVSGATYGLQALSMSMMGMSEDEEESFRNLAAPWQRNSNIMVTGRDSKGNLRLIDMSFLDPYNYWKRPINAIMRDQPMDDALLDVAREAFSPFFGTDIAFGAIVEVLNNKKGSGGPIFNPQAPVWDQAADIINHLRKALQPGIASNLERTAQALEGKISPSGKKYSLQDEAAAWVGFRVTTFDPKTAIYYQAFKFKDEKANATKILSAVARNPNKVSDDDIRRAFKTAMETRFQAYEDMLKLVASAMNQGLTKVQIISILRNSGVSKADAISLANGDVPVWQPSTTFMRNAIKKANVLFGPEVSQEFTRRQQVIEQQFREGLNK